MLQELRQLIAQDYSIEGRSGRCIGLGLLAIAQSIELLSASIHRASVGLMAGAGMLTMEEARAMFGVEEKK